MSKSLYVDESAGWVVGGSGGGDPRDVVWDAWSRGVGKGGVQSSNQRKIVLLARFPPFCAILRNFCVSMSTRSF